MINKDFVKELKEKIFRFIMRDGTESPEIISVNEIDKLVEKYNHNPEELGSTPNIDEGLVAHRKSAVARGGGGIPPMPCKKDASNNPPKKGGWRMKTYKIPILNFWCGIIATLHLGVIIGLMIK